MKQKLLIPKTIKVGYQKRDDTYTQKLAYVIYYDTKGVLRKETSWEGWRDKKIPAQEFDNVPTEGFVLNKKAGGYNSGWNNRATYCRVFDPRGFEFEISIQNLLFILQETSSNKGKGLEGEFVYSWDGKDIVLLPVGSQEYNLSTEFTSLQANKISARDLKQGCSYLTKDMKNLTYLGRFMYYQTTSTYNYQTGYKYVTSGKKQHIFYTEDGDFIPLKSMTKLAKLNSDIEVSDYAEIMDKFNKTKHSTTVESIIGEEMPNINVPRKLRDSYYSSRKLLSGFYKVDENKYQKLDINAVSPSGYYDNSIKGYSVTDGGLYEIKNDMINITMKRTSNNGVDDMCVYSELGPIKHIKKGIKDIDDNRWSNNTKYYYTRQQIKNLELLEIQIKLANGNLVSSEYYEKID